MLGETLTLHLLAPGQTTVTCDISFFFSADVGAHQIELLLRAGNLKMAALPTASQGRETADLEERGGLFSVLCLPLQ